MNSAPLVLVPSVNYVAGANRNNVLVLPPEHAEEISSQRKEREKLEPLLLIGPTYQKKSILLEFHKRTELEMQGLHKGFYGRFHQKFSDSQMIRDSWSRCITEDANQNSKISTSALIDEYDLEEMDLKWQVAMISMRMKKFYKKTGLEKAI
ncbi:hypothetical protein Tco_0855029 [Tanacetum coccineum]